VTLLARRESTAGGELLALTTGGLTTVAARTAEYRFSSAGDFAFTVREGASDALAFARAVAPASAVPVRKNVHSFSFAPDGSALAFVADVAPGKQGDLWVARVAGDGARPGTPEKVASGVGEVRWAPRGGGLAWLADFEPGMRSGALTVRATAGSAPVRLASKVSAYEFSPDGRALAFLEHVVQGGYSVDLKLAQLGAGEARAETVARGVFGFDFAPEGDSLYYRAGCVQSGESCDLERIPAAGLAPGAKAERLAEAVKSFDFDRRTPGRLLVAVQRPDGTPLALAVWRDGSLTAVDRGLTAGTAAFLAPDSSRVVYAVQEKGREGVYVANVGR
jgi:dipeptidyl aminopeptidase/acylaminoacyl peptidase